VKQITVLGRMFRAESHIVVSMTFSVRQTWPRSARVLACSRARVLACSRQREGAGLAWRGRWSDRNPRNPDPAARAADRG